MEHFFQTYEIPEDILWFDEELPVPAKQSAFVSYRSQPFEGFEAHNNGDAPARHRHPNMNKRMVDFLKNSWMPLPMPMPSTETKETERERIYRHMLNERMRRDKQKQSYMTLHKLLPAGTKNDKNSIVQIAAKQIEELQACREEMVARNSELVRTLAAAEVDAQDKEEAKINLKVAYPSSGIDSMLAVLKCLKSTGTAAISITSNLSTTEFSAVLDIETKRGAAEVEKEVHRTLYEVEKKLRTHLYEVPRKRKADGRW